MKWGENVALLEQRLLYTVLYRGQDFTPLNGSGQFALPAQMMPHITPRSVRR